jgi:hypothetical protein
MQGREFLDLAEELLVTGTALGIGERSGPSRVACALLACTITNKQAQISKSEGWPMPNMQCPTCGRQIAPGAGSSGCSHTADNGGADGLAPAPPQELAQWNIERPSPDVLAWARQTFSKAEFDAALREIEQAGGHHFEDFIDEIERIAHGKE